jgi:AcrR family transcriptional regulator
MRDEIESLGDDLWGRYEEWDVSIPPLPPRSRLYRLEPIGIGTPYVESLTGYIARLAETHCVTPKDLVMLEIMPPQSQTGPILNYYNRLSRFWIKNALTLNGISPIARQWVERLESLTTCNHLTFLTMLTFHEVIATSRLLRQSKAWCGQCYEEWRQAHQVVYDPLLWSVNGIDICLRHRQPLVTRCPSCQKTLPFLTQTTRPGYCPRCTHWLGSSKGSLNMFVQSDEPGVSAYQHWVVEVSGNLLAAAPSLAVLPSKKQIAIRVKAFLDQYAAGNIRKLARLSGVGFNAIWHYLHQGSVPYFDSFLKMCFALSITPLEFLSTTTIPSLKDVGFNIESVPTISRGKGKHVTEDDVQRMRQVLEAVQAVDDQVDPFPSLNDVAKRMGFDESTVRRHCPDLSKAISWHSKNHWVEESHLGVMNQALEDTLANVEPESLANVARKLRCSTSSMWKYFPGLCRAIVTRCRERFDDALIEQQLREVLASNAEAPAVHELARGMGYERQVLLNRFPDLCKQISRRRYAERRRRREERIALLCKEIRQVAYHLHSQGIYPSARQVSQELGDSHALLSKEGRDAWCQALEALGYPTVHLKKYT